MNSKLEEFKSLMLKAFEETYNEGFKDGLRGETSQSDDYVIKKVDFGLPGGNIWGVVCKAVKDGCSVPVRLTFPEAEKFNIPTWEEFHELTQQTRMEFDGNLTGRTTCTMRGPNGKTLCIYNFYGMTGAERAKGLKVWLKEPLNEKMEGKVGWLKDDKKNWDHCDSELFSGDGAVVMVLDK